MWRHPRHRIRTGPAPVLLPGHDPHPLPAMPYKIAVNRDLCASNAKCVSLAPEVFELDDQDMCVVIDPEGAKDKRILLAARACPIDAITLIDHAGEQVWP